MATCRSCGARIFWATTEARGAKPAKSIPLDAAEDGRPLVVANGNIVLLGDDHGTGARIVRYVPTGQSQHVSHFATCPNAAEHRRR